MKIKEQTRKLAAGCSKHCFEVADGSKHNFEVVVKLTKSAQNTVLRWQIELTKSAQSTVLRLQIELTWFEEIFEESYLIKFVNIMSLL
ncbi:hypothetical protein [Streptococcus pneumoniae]|uniref:hypothetical protein n=1 Tax=Streptococcus pneumoniae TaxID=1313 RepID=UPI001CD1B267|nr:hypothetical protein [Streptococcus pneumoniae]